MQPLSILFLILFYFAIIIVTAYFAGKRHKESNASFFNANKQASWYLVAFGMIGATLSGVTFISIPGKVESSQFGYFQLVIGYVLGYLVIGTVLLPLYYKLNLTSIYTYLNDRLGIYSYKTAAWFFIISKTIISNLRLLLVVDVLQTLVFTPLKIPFWVTVSITLLFIWAYTFKSGIKTIVWTDTLQTFFMLAAVVISIYIVSDDLDIGNSSLFSYVNNSDFSRIFFFENPVLPSYFWKQLISGAFIAIAMTGLDQDMMQKNLSCKNLKEAQKNMFWFTISLVIVNALFLILGLLFTEYALKYNIDAHQDQLFPILANAHLGIVVSICFIIGIIAAAYSSVDSALTSLTTSFCIDILEIEKKQPQANQIKIRKQIHFAFVLISIGVILFFKYAIQDASIIDKVLKFVGFTYGPLLGLYAFGLFTKWKIKDKIAPFVALIAVCISILLNLNSEKWFGYSIGFEIIIINGLLTFIGLILIRSQKN
jgi:SSS family solute:Na+ symporter